MVYTAYRLYKAFLTTWRYSKKVFRHAVISKETATFTYNLTPENETYLMNLTAQVTKKNISIVEKYFQELKEDAKLKETILEQIAQSSFKKKKDKRCDYGNKLALYAIVRILKPQVVVENGVEVGFTSVVLCEALRKNKNEGFNGKFIGLDINKNAGYLVKSESKYNSLSVLKCGDAIQSLKSLDTKIDFYFSDGFRSYQYEQSEFSALKDKLNENAVVITNKAKFSKALFEFSRDLSKNYSFFKEEPLDHWYEGAGLGFMY
jgi:predicted O-methyltransferase YrrM